MKTKFSATLLLLSMAIGIRAQPLDFAQALELTLRNNFNINISRTHVKVAEANNTAGNAGFLPTLDADGQYDVGTRNTNITFFDGTEISRPNAQSQNLSALAALEWTVFDGFRMFARRTELRATEELEEQNLRAQIEVASLDLAQVYYRILIEKQLIDVYRQNLQISRNRLNIVENAKGVGSASGLEVDQAMIDVFNDSITLMEQENTWQNLKKDLWLVLGDTAQTPYQLEDGIEIDSTLQLQPLRDSLYKLNSELLAARSEVKISASLVEQARSRFYPEVSLFGNYAYNYSQNEAGQAQQLRSFGPTVGVRVQFNLFNGFNDQRQLRVSQLDYENSRLSLSQARLQAANSLEKAFANYSFYLSVLDLRKENIKRAQKTVDVALKQLELGLINSIDFRTVQLNFLQAETDLFTALFNARLAELQLRVLSGQFSVELR